MLRSLSHVMMLSLVAFALILAPATGFAAAKDKATTSSKSADKAKSPVTANHKVIVYYFHGNYRCTNCTNFEKYTDEVMNTTFADARKKGLVDWRIINTEKSGNEHYMQDYQLYTKSVVVVNVKDGKQTEYKNLQGIWQLVGNKAKFQEYIAKEVSDYLGAK